MASNPKVCIDIATETPLLWVTTADMRTLKKPALHHERPDNSLFGDYVFTVTAPEPFDADLITPFPLEAVSEEQSAIA